MKTNSLQLLLIVIILGGSVVDSTALTTYEGAFIGRIQSSTIYSYSSLPDVESYIESWPSVGDVVYLNYK